MDSRRRRCTKTFLSGKSLLSGTTVRPGGRYNASNLNRRLLHMIALNEGRKQSRPTGPRLRVTGVENPDAYFGHETDDHIYDRSPGSFGSVVSESPSPDHGNINEPIDQEVLEGRYSTYGQSQLEYIPDSASIPVHEISAHLRPVERASFIAPSPHSRNYRLDNGDLAQSGQRESLLECDRYGVEDGYDDGNDFVPEFVDVRKSNVSPIIAEERRQPTEHYLTLPLNSPSRRNLSYVPDERPLQRRTLPPLKAHVLRHQDVDSGFREQNLEGLVPRRNMSFERMQVQRQNAREARKSFLEQDTRQYVTEEEFLERENENRLIAALKSRQEEIDLALPNRTRPERRSVPTELPPVNENFVSDDTSEYVDVEEISHPEEIQETPRSTRMEYRLMPIAITNPTSERKSIASSASPSESVDTELHGGNPDNADIDVELEAEPVVPVSRKSTLRTPANRDTRSQATQDHDIEDQAASQDNKRERTPPKDTSQEDSDDKVKKESDNDSSVNKPDVREKEVKIQNDTARLASLKKLKRKKKHRICYKAKTVPRKPPPRKSMDQESRGQAEQLGQRDDRNENLLTEEEETKPSKRYSKSVQRKSLARSVTQEDKKMEKLKRRSSARQARSGKLSKTPRRKHPQSEEEEGSDDESPVNRRSFAKERRPDNKVVTNKFSHEESETDNEAEQDNGTNYTSLDRRSYVSNKGTGRRSQPVEDRDNESIGSKKSTPSSRKRKAEKSSPKRYSNVKRSNYKAEKNSQDEESEKEEEESEAEVAQPESTRRKSEVAKKKQRLSATPVAGSSKRVSFAPSCRGSPGVPSFQSTPFVTHSTPFLVQNEKDINTEKKTNNKEQSSNREQNQSNDQKKKDTKTKNKTKPDKRNPPAKTSKYLINQSQDFEPDEDGLLHFKADDIRKNDEEFTPGLRRGKRVRVPRLRTWMGDKVIYQDTKEGRIVKEIRVVHPNSIPEENENKQAGKGKKQGTKKTHEETILKDAVSECNPVIPFFDEDGSEREGELIHTPGMTNLKAAGKGMLVQKYFRRRKYAVGELVLQPKAEKTLQLVKQDEMIFRVIHGRVLVTIHTTGTELSAGSSFIVPSGNVYAVKNLEDREAALYFIQIKSIRDDELRS